MTTRSVHPVVFSDAEADSVSNRATAGIAMPQNDTQVFYEMRFDIRAGENVWTGRNGRAEAILRSGYLIGTSPGWCPHEWIDARGYVDLELSRKHPYGRLGMR
jgi:hypothetical protein